MSALSRSATSGEARGLRLFLGGDTMTGRGIDQILPHPSAPELHEAWVRDAKDYVALAEAQHGRIESPVSFDYVWGDGLLELEWMRPDLRIINLETSVTTSSRHYADKGIHYRMHPGNLPCLVAAGIDCCVLANNHVLDWGVDGLSETLATLARAGIHVAGAGIDAEHAARPATISIPSGHRVLVFAYGLPSSGIPFDWAAGANHPGINLLPDLSPRRAARLAATVRALRQPGDVVVASLHWGPNWGYSIPGDEIRFAHKLIDEGAADVIHGHSSHHPKGIEIYRGRPVIYGCGDLLNDYEGIGGRERFRGDLALMYFPNVSTATGTLIDFPISVMQIRRLQLNHPTPADAQWMADHLARLSERFHTRVLRREHRLTLEWTPSHGTTA